MVGLTILNVRCFLFMAGISTCDSSKTIDVQFSDGALLIISLITEEMSSSSEPMESTYNKK